MRSRKTLSLTPHWAGRWSLITLCAEGVGPSTAEVSLSSSESANKACSSTSQQRAPPANPRRVRSTPKQLREFPDFGCAVPARIGPQLHQQGRRVGPGLGHPPSQGTAVPFGAMPLSGLLHSQSRFEAGPHLLRSADTLAWSQLQLERLGTDATRPPPHLEPPGLVDHAQVQVLNKNVGANSPTCFTADSCRCNFRKPSAPENSCHNTHEDVEMTAALAGVGNADDGERTPSTPAFPNVRLNSSGN